MGRRAVDNPAPGYWLEAHGRYSQARSYIAFELASRYDPELEPEMNLPGGKLNAGQRYFVDKVWRPLARPRLVAAGFWQIATID